MRPGGAITADARYPDGLFRRAEDQTFVVGVAETRPVARPVTAAPQLLTPFIQALVEIDAVESAGQKGPIEAGIPDNQPRRVGREARGLGPPALPGNDARIAESALFQPVALPQRDRAVQVAHGHLPHVGRTRHGTGSPRSARQKGQISGCDIPGDQRRTGDQHLPAVGRPERMGYGPKTTEAAEELSRLAVFQTYEEERVIAGNCRDGAGVGRPGEMVGPIMRKQSFSRRTWDSTSTLRRVCWPPVARRATSSTRCSWPNSAALAASLLPGSRKPRRRRRRLDRRRRPASRHPRTRPASGSGPWRPRSSVAAGRIAHRRSARRRRPSTLARPRRPNTFHRATRRWRRCRRPARKTSAAGGSGPRPRCGRRRRLRRRPRGGRPG